MWPSVLQSSRAAFGDGVSHALLLTHRSPQSSASGAVVFACEVEQG